MGVDARTIAEDLSTGGSGTELVEKGGEEEGGGGFGEDG